MSRAGASIGSSVRPAKASAGNSCSKSCRPSASKSELGAHPAGKRDVLSRRLEHDLHWLADVDRARIDVVDRPVRALEKVADEADQRILVEFDDDHVVGRHLGEGGQQRWVGNDIGPHAASSRHRLPLVVEGVAVGAHRSGWKPEAPTVRAPLDAQLARGRALPEPGRVLADGRKRRPLNHGYAFLSRRALVGTPSPLVTRDVSAPSTWLVDVPRIWRTPSTMRLKPCT